MNSGRELLIYLAIIYGGDYNSIMAAIAKRYDPDYYQVKQVVDALECKTLTYIDPEYPEYLKKVPGGPLVLFYYGDISLIDDAHFKYNLAVVGTREATEYGLHYTRKIVTEVSKDCNIISGMASGIDAEAHRAALDAGAKTVAILGSGIDYPWPLENAELYHSIINNGGLVVSEYPGMTQPFGSHFPIRNRLIAMFSRAVLVVEALNYRSGTSITVNFANAYGRDVMCIPLPLDVEGNLNNQLLYEGAMFVRNGQDILIDMDLEEIKII